MHLLSVFHDTSMDLCFNFGFSDNSKSDLTTQGKYMKEKKVGQMQIHKIVTYFKPNNGLLYGF